jgi:Tfp pilus assembly protein PilX
MSLKRAAHEESGSALIAAIIILFIIFGLGMAALATSDVQTHQTGHETAGEAAFNLAESALDAEGYRLQQTWATATNYMTSPCNQSATPTSLCPGTAVTSSFTSSYAGQLFANPQWSTQIVDVVSPESPTYYTDSVRGSVPAYDSQKNNKLWVRAQATVGGQTRIVVAEMVRQPQVISLPKTVITAGGVYTSNDGNKIIIESQDNAQPSTGAGPLNIRCGTGGTTPTYGGSCAGWDPNKGQLDPSGNYQAGYQDPNSNYPNEALSDGDIALLRATAQAQQTYYNGVCPTSLNGLVFVDNPPGGNCTYTSGSFNGPYTSSPCTLASPCPASTATPGAIIFGSGTLEFNGPVNYFGVIYMVNPPHTSATCTTPNGPIFTIHGGASVFGGIFVDNCGSVDAGDSAANVEFDSAAFGGVLAYSTPALAKNTFQILSNS